MIGQETLDLIKSYAPEKAEKNYDEFSGFQKVIKMAGLALEGKDFEKPYIVLDWTKYIKYVFTFLKLFKSLILPNLELCLF